MGFECLADARMSLNPDSLEKFRGIMEDEMRQHSKFARLQEEHQSFLSPQMHREIDQLCQYDESFRVLWDRFTANVRAGLNDTIVRGVIQWHKQMMDMYVRERDRLNTRNLDNIRTLGSAAKEVLRMWPEAQAKGDLVYMERVIEELDAAVYDTIEVHDDESKG
jgi:hypothetical protein